MTVGFRETVFGAASPVEGGYCGDGGAEFEGLGRDTGYTVRREASRCGSGTFKERGADLTAVSLGS